MKKRGSTINFKEDLFGTYKTPNIYTLTYWTWRFVETAPYTQKEQDFKIKFYKKQIHSIPMLQVASPTTLP